MNLKEAKELFRKYDGSLYVMWHDDDRFDEFTKLFIPFETLEKWRREMVDEAFKKGYPLNRTLRMIRDAKYGQERYADRFLELLETAQPKEKDAVSLLKNLLSDNMTCGYNWLKQFVSDDEKLAKAVGKLLKNTSFGDDEELGKKLTERYEFLSK
ncbi:MAG: hypothetical protein IJG59_05780 [Erysipelotrichaceae bacterium]|nr:hypothetical protein [Erysipelotrichaceae bacterium]